MTARSVHELKLSTGARRAFRELDEEIAGRVAAHLGAIAERQGDARLPFSLVMEVAGIRIAYELRSDQVYVWSIVAA